MKDRRLQPKYEQTQTLNFSYVGSYSRAQALYGLKQQPEELYAAYEDQLVFVYDIPRDCARNLIHSYGTMSTRVAELGMADPNKKGTKSLNERVHEDYPFLKSEFLYAIRHEMAEKPNDVLCRRVPIAFLNKEVALKVLPELVEMMAKERKWSSAQKKQELEEAIRLMEYMK